MHASQRPPVAERRFISQAVERTLTETKAKIADPEIAWLFENCFPNTLDTTVFYTPGEKPDTFVITGDIHAMWLRDSTAQVWPYLPLVQEDPHLSAMIEGLVRRQAACVLLDPYANAFNDGPAETEWVSDLTEMKEELHERKWEIDSLCYVVRLAYGYWKASGSTKAFDAQWLKAMSLLVDTLVEQQRKEGTGPYTFQRVTPRPIDSVPLGGWGYPTRKVGLIHSMFRPSDDSCVYPFLVPSNFFAVVSLRQLAEILDEVFPGEALAVRARSLADEVARALALHAAAEHPEHGLVWPYEVDGYGNVLYMDDANVPSLLALPYLGAVEHDDPMYLRTRGLVLSEDNPYFFKGSAGEGIGGPHVGVPYIWPMGIILRALTSSDDEEIAHCLEMLKTTHAGTGFMHESFHCDDPSRFTRTWFAWVNTLFGELILKLVRERPHLVC